MCEQAVILPTVNPIVERNNTAATQPCTMQFNCLAFTHLFIQYNNKKNSLKSVQMHKQEPIIAQGVSG